jgi:hypothetical protein
MRELEAASGLRNAKVVVNPLVSKLESVSQGFFVPIETDTEIADLMTVIVSIVSPTHRCIRAPEIEVTFMPRPGNY